MSEATAIRGIEQAAERRDEAANLRRAATSDLRRYCLEAQKAGVPITRIALKAGLSRQGLYDLLAERPSA